MSISLQKAIKYILSSIKFWVLVVVKIWHVVCRPKLNFALWPFYLATVSHNDSCWKGYNNQGSQKWPVMSTNPSDPQTSQLQQQWERRKKAIFNLSSCSSVITFHLGQVLLEKDHLCQWENVHSMAKPHSVTVMNWSRKNNEDFMLPKKQLSPTHLQYSNIRQSVSESSYFQ